MIQDDKRLEAALTRLSAALASLEAASRRIPDPDAALGTRAPNLDRALEYAEMKVAKLEAANTEVARVLAGATKALAEIVSKQAESIDT